MKRRGRGSQCAQASPAVRLLLAGDVLPDLKLNTEEFIFEVSKAFFGGVCYISPTISHSNTKFFRIRITFIFYKQTSHMTQTPYIS